MDKEEYNNSDTDTFKNKCKKTLNKLLRSDEDSLKYISDEDSSPRKESPRKGPPSRKNSSPRKSKPSPRENKYSPREDQSPGRDRKKPIWGDKRPSSHKEKKSVHSDCEDEPFANFQCDIISPRGRKTSHGVEYSNSPTNSNIKSSVIQLEPINATVRSYKWFNVILGTELDTDDNFLIISGTDYESRDIVQNGYLGTVVSEDNFQYYLVYSKVEFLTQPPIHLSQNSFNEDKVIKMFKSNFPIMVKSKLYDFTEFNFKHVFLLLMYSINERNPNVTIFNYISGNKI